MAGWVQALSLVKDFVPRLIDVDNLLKSFLHSRRDDVDAMRSGLDNVNASHASLQRSLDENSRSISALAEEMYTLRVTSSSLLERLQNIESSTSAAATWARIATGISALALGAVIFLIVHRQ